MDKFLKFPKIRNYSLLDVERFKLEDEYYKEKYVVTEKIHGTNFALYCTKDGKVEVASRVQLLTEKDLKGNNILKGVDTKVNFEKVKDVAQKVFKDNPEFEYLIVGGEYYGKGIFNMGYKENKVGETAVRFFSVIGVLKNEEEEKIGLALGMNELKELFTEDELVPVLEIGVLSEMLDKYSKLLDEPSKLGGETIEGYVLTPLKTLQFDYNQECPTQAVKIKSEEFLDVVTNNKAKTYELNGLNINRVTPYEYEVVKELYEKYMNKQRIESVVSHGKYPLEMKYLININEEVVKDMLEDYSENVVNDKIKFSLKKVTLLDVKAYLQARFNC